MPVVLSVVIAGLDPAIHPLSKNLFEMDAWVKPAHDECECGDLVTSPPKPIRLARQFDGLDLLELDGALGHHVVDVAVGRAGNLRTVEIDGRGRPMILFGPGRGIANTFH